MLIALARKIKRQGLAKAAIAAGGSLHPLLIPAAMTNGTGLMNPSVYADGDRLLCNIRHVNYTLYHSEIKRFQHRYGPLQYLHPENDRHLRTWNYLAVLNHDLTIKQISAVDTARLDQEPIWEFVGLEDARLFRWDHTLYLSGVRRDTTTHGEGRMELSAIAHDGVTAKEVSRVRLPAPGANTTYCEKNWMPVLDQPYHYVKWSNPTEVVRVDPDTRTTTTVHLDESTRIPDLPDFRGGSQVIPYGDHYLAITHEVDLTKHETGEKDAVYRHRFLIWDRQWNLVRYTDSFDFLHGDIEFCCGAAWWQGDLLISFGFQDNAAFILRLPRAQLDHMIWGDHARVAPQKQPWQHYPAPTLEITTIIPEKGCVVDCVFCPQRTLEKVYTGDRILTLDNFKRLIDRVPRDVRITFAGFTEPWMNKHATQMVLHAHESGHPVSVFTTAVGLSVEDCEAMAHIPFAGDPNGGFTVHLPDSELLARHPITPGFIRTLEWLRANQDRIKNFRVMSMGPELHASIRHIFDSAPYYKMYSRAGNLFREALMKPQLIRLKDRWHAVEHPDKTRTCGCVEHLYHNVLLPNGDVSLCCMDYGLDHILGNLYQQTYEHIIPQAQTCFDLCNSCENGVKPTTQRMEFQA